MSERTNTGKGDELLTKGREGRKRGRDGGKEKQGRKMRK